MTMNNQQGLNISEKVDSTLNEPPTCFRCNKYIYDGTILKVNGQFWHNACLQCTVCCRQVSGLCHFHDDDVYCRADFIRSHSRLRLQCDLKYTTNSNCYKTPDHTLWLFGAKCQGCSKVISPSEGARVVNGNVYHSTCFTCVSCRRPLQTGDYLYVNDDGKLLCYQDYKQTTCSDDSSPTDSESDESGSDEVGRSRRTCLNDNQLCSLVDSYQSNKRPNKSQRTLLSRNTGLSQRDVQLWFRNKRRSERKAKHFDNIKQISNQTGSNMLSPISSPSVNTSCQQNSLPVRNNYQMSLPSEESQNSQYQLYCPLDYMVPGSMPPNIDLTNASICNGEIVFNKPTGSENKTSQGMQNNYFNENIRQWLTV